MDKVWVQYLTVSPQRALDLEALRDVCVSVCVAGRRSSGDPALSPSCVPMKCFPRPAVHLDSQPAASEVLQMCCWWWRCWWWCWRWWRGYCAVLYAFCTLLYDYSPLLRVFGNVCTNFPLSHLHKHLYHHHPLAAEVEEGSTPFT